MGSVGFTLHSAPKLCGIYVPPDWQDTPQSNQRETSAALKTRHGTRQMHEEIPFKRSKVHIDDFVILHEVPLETRLKESNGIENIQEE